jgi:hypothetical protein
MLLSTYRRHVVLIGGEIDRIEQSRIGNRGLDLSLPREMGDELTECLDGIDDYVLYKGCFHRI